ncbi:MAG: hypothetical protein AAF487_08130 [Bacteroidota bacterium]
MAKERSSFLNILTILSFVGIGIFLIIGIFSIVTGTVAQKTYFSSEEAYEKAQKDIVELYAGQPELGMAAIAEMEATRHLRSNGFMIVFGQIFCLLGVLKMRKGNKVGFALYSIGELGVPIASIIFMGGMGIFGVIIGLVFVILYGTRLEEMRLHRAVVA